MSTVMMRVSDEARDIANTLADETKESAGDVTLKALKLYQEQLFWKKVQEAYAARTPEEVAEDNAELALWDATLQDGLHAETNPT